MTSHICAKHSTNVWFAILFHVFNGTPPHTHARMRTKAHHKKNKKAEEKINTDGKKKEKSVKES